MKSTNYMKNPKKVGKVIRTPGFILRIQGKMDSKKGKGVCDEYIQSVVRKLASMEGDEVIQAENALHDVRKEAAVILAEFSEKKEDLSEIPENTGGKTVEEIRNNRRKSTRRRDAANRLKEAMNKLTRINEQIINTNTVLDERINKLRNNAAEKLHAYISGIRCGNLTEYTFELPETDDDARQIYLEKHERLDKKIRDIVDRRFGEEEVA
ncbi:MAG: hypothetical protein SO181_06990 [Frisingicoccus sp.]|uniref:hypothetical protein n=1 Tax=Frisingicoccus sp. TaxID=1918627 RepID=UPI002A83D67C|nr:hypothetical protein [Frisingicoccus sp.]MDY4834868.1 hypothetical protein [Frisingicoccus sp.]